MVSISSCQYRLLQAPFEKWQEGLFVEDLANDISCIIGPDGEMILAEKCIAKKTPQVKILPEGLKYLTFLLKAIEKN